MYTPRSSSNQNSDERFGMLFLAIAMIAMLVVSVLYTQQMLGQSGASVAGLDNSDAPVAQAQDQITTETAAVVPAPEPVTIEPM